VATGQRDQLLHLAHWRLDGRIAVRTSADAFQASLQWEHERAQDRVLISGPFNQGGVSIVLQDKLILVRESGGEVKTSSDPAALLRKELGFAVPLSSLRYWVIGIAEPAASSIPTYDEAGQLRLLSQAGWQLRYENFIPVEGLMLPQKLAGQGGDMSLKLVVDDWQIFR
jgi:outer membrane lipoprotein LolB